MARYIKAEWTNDDVLSPSQTTGKWKCICSTDYWQYTYEHYRCSECGIPAECAFGYCPNCGAKMKGEDDAEIH